MKFFKLLTRFFVNGVDVFREASRGEYNREVKEISMFRTDLFSEGNQLDDKKKLVQDRSAIGRDVQSAWNRIVLSNG